MIKYGSMKYRQADWEAFVADLFLRVRQVLLLALATALFASPVAADKPDKAGGGKHKSKPSHEKHDEGFKRYDEKHSQQRDRYQHERYFNEHHRTAVRDYYVDEFQHGRCPPGLAKKHNGCLPPGQAKRWQIGRPLPRDVMFYDLPDHLYRQIGYPPAGYRFVRVASDILMIAVGSGLVVDAIADLSALQ